MELGTSDAPRTALCISGGGIRSATFALGALQGFADLGILQHFDYLSTVSGGGYIGSWLTGWKQRWGGLTKKHSWGKTETSVVTEMESSAPQVPEDEIDPIQHLREYNNYLSPKLGLFSADTWTLAATVARNMFLNWLVFIPLLMFALILPRILLSLARLGETYQIWYLAGAESLLSQMKYVIPVAGGLLFAIGVFNVLRYLPSVGNKDHTQGEFLLWCGAPIFLAAAALIATDAWFTGGDKTNPSSVSFVEYLLWIGGFNFAGWLAYLPVHIVVSRRQNRQQKSSLPPPKNPIITPHGPLTWKLAGGLTGALVLTVASVACAAWLLTSEHFRYLSWPVYVTIALPMLLLFFALAVTVFVGLTSIVLEDEDREWLARSGAWILLTTVTWAGFCALTLLAPTWAFSLGAWAKSSIAAAGGIGGWIAAAAGLSSKTNAQKTENG
ncbi:MAG TPA: patatin-like phospholipase family protein, partial [Candidatus Angelobacter sp.]